MSSEKTYQRRAFTIVELLLVISVIGILVTIVIAVYPGYQKRTRDNERKSDVGQIASAIGAYAVQKNDYMTTGSGCGLNGNGNGWIDAGPANIAAYPKSIATCLQEAGALTNAADFIDPSGCIFDSGGSCGSSGGQVKAYMKATCQKNGSPVTYVLAYIESDPPKNAEVDALCDPGTVNGYTTTTQKWGTTYGMNYYTTAK